jgi:hypothetical protein
MAMVLRVARRAGRVVPCLMAKLAQTLTIS